VGYATGQTDKFQGTGVYKDIKYEREPKDDDKAPASDKAEKKKAVSKK
jgi:hypothetical protein